MNLEFDTDKKTLNTTINAKSIINDDINETANIDISKTNITLSDQFEGGLDNSWKLNNGDGKIRIADTCPLGNKQYLVIAQCDQEKFLLGVSPNGFHHITNLKNEDSEMKPSNEPKKPNSN